MSTFTLRKADTEEIDNWDDDVLKNKNEAGFLQSKPYADTKKCFGWNIQYMVYESKNERVYVYFLEKFIPTLGYLWYLPSGSLALRDIDSILRANKRFIKQNKLRVFVIKIEPRIPDSPHTRRQLSRLGLRRSTPIQAHSSTIILDLHPPNDLFNSLSAKARRDIRLAQKQSVLVKHQPFSATTCEIMYSLMRTVSRGKGSAHIRPFSYYYTFWHNFSLMGYGSFYFAYEGERPVAGAFIINFGDTSTYKDGGSTPDTIYKNRYGMAVQWQALQDARETSSLYDLCGVPSRSQLDDPNHPYHGIGQFKLKFKRETVDFCGCYDQVLDPVRYFFWKKLQRIIYKLHWLIHRDLYF